jgi:hypothetical protein
MLLFKYMLHAAFSRADNWDYAAQHCPARAAIWAAALAQLQLEHRIVYVPVKGKTRRRGYGLMGSLSAVL